MGKLARSLASELGVPVAYLTPLLLEPNETYPELIKTNVMLLLAAADQGEMPVLRVKKASTPLYLAILGLLVALTLETLIIVRRG